MNQMLAQWAGFELIPVANSYMEIYCKKEQIKDKTKPLFYLDFVNSLSNCFEWLVPKMKNCSMIFSKDNGYTAQVTLENGSRAEYSSDSPPVSLCVALESLLVAK